MFVDFNYAPLIEDYNVNGRMKLEAVLKILENSGNQHSDKAGDSILKGSSGGVAWILTDWYVDIQKMPVYGQKIRARTWSQGVTSIFGTNREFELYADDQLCGAGTTKWISLDLKNGRPLKITPELLAKYEPETKAAFDNPKLSKIEIPQSFTNEIVITPRRNDVDFNNHVHNLAYLDYAMEAIPEALYKAQSFTKVRITYKNGVKEGEQIKVKYAPAGDSHTVIICGLDDSVKTLLQFA